MRLTTAQRDRAHGVLLATAAGDALGAPYEFEPPRGPDLDVEMVGGGGVGWEPGEWTDDTSMAIAIAQVAATGRDLRTTQAQDLIVAAWCEWAKGAKDVGIQTRSVLTTAVHAVQPPTADAARAAAAAHHRRTGRSGGNGTLMRTAPVALAYLDDETALIDAATAISTLTHVDPEAAQACVLWCLAIRTAVLTGQLDLRAGLSHLPPSSRELWRARIDEAEQRRPADFANNGWVVSALQAAWSAIYHTSPVREDNDGEPLEADRLRSGLDAAVRAGNDTDTVAAIAGGLLGACYGASAVPAAWRRLLHGWPSLRARDLHTLTAGILSHGAPDTFDFTYAGRGTFGTAVPHPYDEGLLLGDIGALRPLPPEVDTIVSLCRVGDADIPPEVEHIEVRLIDRNGAEHNPDLAFVLTDTVHVLETLRAEGRTVLLHCVHAKSRTPAVAALYGARREASPFRRLWPISSAYYPALDPSSTSAPPYNSCTATTTSSEQAPTVYSQKEPPQDPTRHPTLPLPRRRISSARIRRQ